MKAFMFLHNNVLNFSYWFSVVKMGHLNEKSFTWTYRTYFNGTICRHRALNFLVNVLIFHAMKNQRFWCSMFLNFSSFKAFMFLFGHVLIKKKCNCQMVILCQFLQLQIWAWSPWTQCSIKPIHHLGTERVYIVYIL